MKFKIALKVGVVSLITTFFVFLGDKDGILLKLQKEGYIGAAWDIDFLQLTFFSVGTFFGVVFISYPLYKAELKLLNDEIIIFDILRYSKSDFLKLFCTNIKESNANIDIRILIPKQNFFDRIKNISHKYIKCPKDIRVFYKIVNIKDLHVDETKDDLYFELHPNPQGIVGRVYSERAIVLDFNMKSKNVKQIYNLTEYQYSETADLEFCAAFPILNYKNEIIAMVSFDSKNKVTINEKRRNQIEDIVRKYAKFLHLQFSLLNKNKL